MKSNLLSLLVALTLLLTMSSTPVTAQAKLSRPNLQVTLNGYAAPEPPSGTANNAPAAVTRSEATQARMQQSFGQLPLYFVENQGQLDERVAYTIQGSDKEFRFFGTSRGIPHVWGHPNPSCDMMPSDPQSQEKGTGQWVHSSRCP